MENLLVLQDIVGCCSVVRGIEKGVAKCCSICTYTIYRGFCW